MELSRSHQCHKAVDKDNGRMDSEGWEDTLNVLDGNMKIWLYC